MSIGEALDVSERFVGVVGELPDRVLWLFADDESNYAGIFASGPLAGFVTLLVHDDPSVAPRFRSAVSFMRAILEGSVGDEPRCDIPDVLYELPVSRDDPADVDRFRMLAFEALDRWRGLRHAGSREDEDLRRVWASAALCLLPVADTNAAVELLDDPDMWTPEQVATLLESRNHDAAVPRLERLAREGTPNGDGAAMRALVRFGTPEAQEAIARLRKVLKGQKRQLLEQVCRRSSMDAQARPGAGPERFSLLGVASCAVFGLSALAFVHWWKRFGVCPVIRATNAWTPLSDFLETWTRIFTVAALSGAGLASVDLWRGSRPRTAALAGLILNVVALVALLVLTSTGIFPAGSR